MVRVQLAPIGWAVVGVAVLLAVAPTSGWAAAIGYLTLSNLFLAVGLRRRRAIRFGPANVVTAARSTLVGIVTGVVVASLVEPVSSAVVVALVVPALLLDAVDGWVARRTGTSSELGARFDMEVDAFLLLVLGVFVAERLGPWVLAIGLMRYAFVVAGWLLPWMRQRLPFRYWRKVVTAAQGIALVVAAAVVPVVLGDVLVGVALVLLVESFGRDVVWLAQRRTGRTDA